MAMKHEEHFGDPRGRGQPKLHVFQEEHGGEWEVWLNTGVADFDGLCVGVGSTRQAAIADAVKVFEWAEGALQGPPPRTFTGGRRGGGKVHRIDERSTPAEIDEARRDLAEFFDPSKHHR